MWRHFMAPVLKRLLPQVQRVYIFLVGPEVPQQRKMSFESGWLDVYSHPGRYDDFRASRMWGAPTLWLAENVGLHDAVWSSNDGSCVERATRETWSAQHIREAQRAKGALVQSVQKQNSDKHVTQHVTQNSDVTRPFQSM